jgi:hypothetical protein
MVHDQTLFDVGRLKSFPDSNELRRVAEQGRQATKEFTFEQLARLMTGQIH